MPRPDTGTDDGLEHLVQHCGCMMLVIPATLPCPATPIIILTAGAALSFPIIGPIQGHHDQAGSSGTQGVKGCEAGGAGTLDAGPVALLAQAALESQPRLHSEVESVR